MPAVRRLPVAILSASAITLALGLAYALHLERPYWAGIAAMVLSQSAQGESLQKGIWRMAGTVAGALGGMAVLAWFGESLASVLAAFAVLLALLVMLMHESRYRYFYYSTALMAVLVAAQSHGEAPFRIACARMLENVVGIAAYTLCALCFRPKAAYRELDGLNFGLGVFRELAGHFRPARLLDRFLTAGKALISLSALVAVWQGFAPPGTESTLFVEIGALLILLGAMTDRFSPGELLFSFVLGIGAALFLYSVVLPQLPGFPELAAVIFALAFLMAFLLPEPEQGMARMGLLMPVFVLSGVGGENFGPEAFASASAGLLCSALTVSLIAFLLEAPGSSVPKATVPEVSGPEMAGPEAAIPPGREHAA